MALASNKFCGTGAATPADPYPLNAAGSGPDRHEKNASTSFIPSFA
jgi:hypothetical protein